MELKPRDTQTQVKHHILGEYLKVWGSIIINGLRGTAAKLKAQSKTFELHLVYVDCCAYCGRYVGDRSDILLGLDKGIVYGSPIIGIQALDQLRMFGADAGVQVRVNSILAESTPEIYESLIESLELAGFGRRLRFDVKLTELKDEEIALRNVDYLQILPEILSYTSGRTFSFYLLDPYGPKGIPHHAVADIVRHPHADVMINFPYQDLHKKAHLVLQKHDDPKVQDIVDKLIDNYTRVYGDNRWKQVVENIQAEKPFRDALDVLIWEGEELLTLEEALVQHYREVLQEADQSLAVKLESLQFPDKDRTMFYLFLTTHDGTGALSLNQILANAKQWEFELRSKYRVAKKSKPPPGQMPLFTVESITPGPTPIARPTLHEIARDLAQRFSGKTVTKREAYRELANDNYFPDEVDRALAHLKKNKQVDYKSPLLNDTLIKFSA